MKATTLAVSAARMVSRDTMPKTCFASSPDATFAISCGAEPSRSKAITTAAAAHSSRLGRAVRATATPRASTPTITIGRIGADPSTASRT